MDCAAQASVNQVLFALGTHARRVGVPVFHVLGPVNNYLACSWRAPAVPLCTDELSCSTCVLLVCQSVLVAPGSARSFCMTGFEQITNHKNAGAY